MFTGIVSAVAFLAVAAATPVVTQINDGQTQASVAAVSPVGAAATPTFVPPEASPFGPYSYPQMPTVNSASVESVVSVAGIPASEIPGATAAVPPVVSSQVTGLTFPRPILGYANHHWRGHHRCACQDYCSPSTEPDRASLQPRWPAE